MNSIAQVGQWYTRLDTKQTFLVTGYDDKSRTIETQAINGDLDEMDDEIWNVLPLAFAEPPEEWTEAIDDEEVLDADSSDAR
jgi:hypothetical protein